MKTRMTRTAKVLGLAVAITAALAPGARAADGSFVPGYSDFPNHLRIGDAPEVPGYSDFPNHLRVESVYDRARVHSGGDGRVVTIAQSESGFHWEDAAVGAGGAALVLTAAALAASLLRRPVRRVAAAG